MSPRNDPKEPRAGWPDRGTSEPRARTAAWWSHVALAVLASGAILYLGRTLFVPIIAALLLSAMLLPIVRGLTRIGLPAPLAAGAVILGLLGVSYVAVSRLTAPALEWMDELPQALREAKPKLASLREPVDQVTKAAKSIEEAAGDSDESGAIEVVERGPGLSGRVLAHLGAGAQGAFVAGFLLFFLLSDGVSFLGGFLGVLSGRRDRRLGRAVARSVEAQIARYVATITLINAALGACVGLAMNLLGVPNPALWGVLVALLNFVPYVGAVIGITVLGAVALVTFDTPVRIVLPPLIYFLLNGLEGMLITPLIIGKRWLVRPALVFLWLVLWSWLWGIPGALLATPMLVAFKITCDALPMLRPVAAVLGREERDPIEDGGGRAVVPGPGESA